MQMSSSGRGFSLIEAIVAVAVLLATCLAVSASLAVALQADRQVERRDTLEGILGSESARLASLPFRRTTAPPVAGVAWSPDPRSLLGEVFPHADAGHDGDGSYHVEGGVGVFVASRTTEGFEIFSEARFVRRKPRRVGTRARGVLAGLERLGYSASPCGDGGTAPHGVARLRHCVRSDDPRRAANQSQPYSVCSRRLS